MMEFDYHFTLIAESADQARWIEARTPALQELGHVSVLADAENEIPNRYRFSGRVDLDVQTADEGRERILNALAEAISPNQVGLEWPPDDFGVSLTKAPLAGIWLFGDLGLDDQLWLLERANHVTVSGGDRGFDLQF